MCRAENVLLKILSFSAQKSSNKKMETNLCQLHQPHSSMGNMELVFDKLLDEPINTISFKCFAYLLFLFVSLHIIASHLKTKKKQKAACNPKYMAYLIHFLQLTRKTVNQTASVCMETDLVHTLRCFLLHKMRAHLGKHTTPRGKPYEGSIGLD